MIDNLTSENFIIYAMNAYDKPNCILSEFKQDMKRFNYLKRLFSRYRKYGEMRERLIINHIVVIYNLFGTETSTRLLFYKVSEEDYSILKTYLVFLNFMPEIVRGIKGKDILSRNIPIDTEITEVLRNIK
jgi:hypothetical protein